MNLLDIILALIFGYFLLRGFFRGMIKELTSIVGVLGGVYFAFSYYSPVALYFKPWVPNPAYSAILGFLAIFTGVYLVISIIGVIIKYLLDIAYFGWLDRLLGGVFGAAKGLLIVVVLVGMLTTFLPGKTPFLVHSRFVPQVCGLSGLLLRAGPAEAKKIFEIHHKELQKNWHTTGH